MEIVHKHYPATLAVTVRTVVQKRAEIQALLADLVQQIPPEKIAGPPFCVFNFITSAKDGSDITLGIPVNEEIEADQLKTERVPALEVLALLHQDGPDLLGESVGKVFGYARQCAIISDEFYREVYLGQGDPGGPGIEINFVIHNWNQKLAAGLERVFGAETRRIVMQGSGQLGIESGVDARFEWVLGMLERLDDVADEHQKYAVLSGCAHVFPASQVAKLTTVFDESRAKTADPLQAVDAVIAFMEADPGWVEGGVREAYTITASKPPCDKAAYAEAQTDLERRQAACFCPLIRTKMDQRMPVDFCYCGSGWFRQQWEGATGKPVKIDILKSVLRGDEKCEFAIHLSEDI